MKLLLVENDDVQAEIYHLSLSESFDISTTHSFEAAQQALATSNFDIIVCNWEIDNLNATCLAANTHRDDPLITPIIVVVSEDNRESSMIQAYNGGVSYYITKPYKVIQFTETLFALKHQLLTVRQMRADNQQKAADTLSAKTDSALYELGISILAETVKARSIPDIAKATINAFRLNGVQVAMEFRDGSRPVHFDTNLLPCDDTTVKVFSVLRRQGSTYRFGRRTLFNSADVSLLIKHVADKSGGAHDTLLSMCKMLVPAINQQVMALMKDSALAKTHQDLLHFSSHLNDANTSAERQKLAGAERLAINIVEALNADLNVSYPLSRMLEIVESALETTNGNGDKSASLKDLVNLCTGIEERLKDRMLDMGVKADTLVLESDDEDYRDLEFF